MSEPMDKAVEAMARQMYGYDAGHKVAKARIQEVQSFITALLSLHPSIASVIDGTGVVVPVEATEDMKDAVVDAAQIRDDWGVDKYVTNPADVYRATLAARPK